VNFIYSRFAHGVSSDAMSFMFLYPLLGGCAAYALLGLFFPGARRLKPYRVFTNLYSAGVATLTAGAFLHGILEIAGATSPYARAFTASGWALAAAGAAALAIGAVRARR
jgi:hypothetical protein